MHAYKEAHHTLYKPTRTHVLICEHKCKIASDFLISNFFLCVELVLIYLHRRDA